MSAGQTVFAPGVRPPDFRDYMWLYTEGEPVATVVDGAPPGPEGRLFKVEVGKAKKVPWEAGRFILDHVGYTGVVRVKETEREDGTGTDLDLAAAKEESKAKLEEEDGRRWRDYITYVINDKLDNKKVIPPTPDSIKRIMERRGYRLEDFGVNIPGQPRLEAESGAIKELKAQNAALTAKLEETLAQMKELLGDSGKKGK